MKKKAIKTVNTKTMGVNMNKRLFAEIERRAKKLGISKSLFCKSVLARECYKKSVIGEVI